MIAAVNQSGPPLTTVPVKLNMIVGRAGVSGPHGFNWGGAFGLVTPVALAGQTISFLGSLEDSDANGFYLTLSGTVDGGLSKGSQLLLGKVAVTTLNVTVEGETFDLTWSSIASVNRYEGTSAGIRAQLVADYGKAIAVLINTVGVA